MRNNGAGPQPKPLGLVWIYSSYPVIALGLERILQRQAHTHVDAEPPQVGKPSSVVLCATTPKGVTREARRIRDAYPDAPSLVFGLDVDQRIGKAAFRAGVRGFIHGGMQPEQIVNSVSLASAGEMVVPAEMIESLVAEEAVGGREDLTARQREILGMVSQGMTNAQIAQRLYLSEFTIKQHLRAAYKLLKVKNRTEAARLFRGAPEAGDPEPY